MAVKIQGTEGGFLPVFDFIHPFFLNAVQLVNFELCLKHPCAFKIDINEMLVEKLVIR